MRTPSRRRVTGLLGELLLRRPVAPQTEAADHRERQRDHADDREEVSLHGDTGGATLVGGLLAARSAEGLARTEGDENEREEQRAGVDHR